MTLSVCIVSKLELLWASAYYFMRYEEPQEYARVFEGTPEIVSFGVLGLSVLGEEGARALGEAYLTLRAGVEEGSLRGAGESILAAVPVEGSTFLFYGVKTEESLDLKLPVLVRSNGLASLLLGRLVADLRRRPRVRAVVYVRDAQKEEAQGVAEALMKELDRPGAFSGAAWPELSQDAVTFRRLAADVYGARTMLARQSGFFQSKTPQTRAEASRDSADLEEKISFIREELLTVGQSTLSSRSGRGLSLWWQLDDTRAETARPPLTFAMLRAFTARVRDLIEHESRELLEDGERVPSSWARRQFVMTTVGERAALAESALTLSTVAQNGKTYNSVWRVLESLPEPPKTQVTSRFLPQSWYKRVDAFYGPQGGVWQRLDRDDKDVFWHFGAMLVNKIEYPQFSDYYEISPNQVLVLFSGGDPIKTVATDRQLLPWLLGVDANLDPMPGAEKRNIFSFENVITFLKSPAGAKLRDRIEAQIRRDEGRAPKKDKPARERSTTVEGKVVTAAQSRKAPASITFHGDHAFLALNYPHEVEMDGSVYPSIAAWLVDRDELGPVAPDDHIRALFEKFSDPTLRAKLVATGRAHLDSGDEGNYWGTLLMAIRDEINQSARPNRRPSPRYR